MRLNVTPFDGVVVVLPKRLNRWVNTDRFLKENGPWLLKHMEAAGLRSHGTRSEEFGQGTIVPFRGTPWSIDIDHDAQDGKGVVSLRCGEERLIVKRGRVPESADGLARLTGRWLRREATREITDIVRVEAARLGVSYREVRIRSLKSKWGSCNSDGVLTFNWRLILFPGSVLRYIVIHEICHLVHFDHSEEFWRLVEKQDPEYRTSIEWLRSEGMNRRNLLVDC